MMRISVCQTLICAIIFFFYSCSNDSDSKNSEKTERSTIADTLGRLGKNYLTDCKKLFSDARNMDSVLQQENELDPVKANKAIKAFTDFAFYCNGDTMSPIYLIKTAQVAKSVNNVPQAKTALDYCIENYKSSKHYPAALFLLAQLYDETIYLNNEQEAKRIYNQLITDYPKSDWAESSKGALNFIGKSDEEILKELKKKNK